MSNPAIHLVQGFAKHQKIQKSSQRLFEKSVNAYKLIRNITLYLFDLLQIANVVPAPYSTPFKVAKSAFRIFFETGDIIFLGQKIYQCFQLKERGFTKIEKWTSLEKEIECVRRGDPATINKFKTQFELKLEKFSDDTISVSIERSDRWFGSLDLIDQFLAKGKVENIQKLAGLLQERRMSKIEKWNSYQEKKIFQIKKSVVEIAYSIVMIAIEVLGLVAIALGITSGYLVVGGIVGLICAEVIDLGKLIWCELRNRDNPIKIAAHSVESILVMLAESKIFSESSLLQKSFIKGFLGTYFACKKIPAYRNEMHLNQLDRDFSKEKEKKLLPKRAELLLLKTHIELPHSEVAAERALKKYEDKKNDLEYIVANASKDADWIEKAKAKITKLNGLIAIYSNIVTTKNRDDFRHHVEGRLLSVRRKISNWRLNSDLCRNQNIKAAISIAMNIVEIARFALLGIALTLTLLQFGINFLPIILGAGIAANVLYVGYLIFISTTKSKDVKIQQALEKDEVIDSLVL